MRLASPFIVIFSQTIFNMSRLRTLAFSAKNMCNKKKKFSSFLGGGGGAGRTHQLELQQRKSETLAISRGQIAVISP